MIKHDAEFSVRLSAGETCCLADNGEVRFCVCGAVGGLYGNFGGGAVFQHAVAGVYVFGDGVGGELFAGADWNCVGCAWYGLWGGRRDCELGDLEQSGGGGAAAGGVCDLCF